MPSHVTTIIIGIMDMDPMGSVITTDFTDIIGMAMVVTITTIIIIDITIAEIIATTTLTIHAAAIITTPNLACEFD